MSPSAAQMLVEEIVPRIVGGIARSNIRAGIGEDREELIADTVAMAAKRLHAAEANGATFTAGSVAYFSVQAVKTGTRFCSAGRMDVMSVGCRLDQKCEVVSMDEVLEDDPDDPSYGMTLHDMLADNRESADLSAGRSLDWDDLMPRLNARQQEIVQLSAEGHGTSEIARRFSVSPVNVSIRKRKLAARIRENWGDGIAGEVTTPPRWAKHVRTFQEKRTCRFERRVERVRA